MCTHMHPDHIGLAHWLCERWSTPEHARVPAVDQRTDWNAARMASQSTTGLRRRPAARFFARHGLVDPEALAKVRARANYYASMVPQVPASFQAPDGRHGAAHRRAAIGAASWATATRRSTSRCTAPAAGGADLGRHGAAAHLHQRERDRPGARGQPAAAVPGFDLQRCAGCRTTRWCCLRTANPSPGCTRASSSCTAPRRAPGRSAGACAPRRAARPSCCRCCSSARWTCTRPPLRWANPSPTCTRWPTGKLDAGGRLADGVLRYCTVEFEAAGPPTKQAATAGV
jgi:hypothetical protein